MSSGLKRGTVEVVPYDNTWPQNFERERAALEAIFGEQAVAIEHIGSTAVPGLSAKPIIDIEVGLRTFADWQQFVPPLVTAGYTYMPDRIKTDEVFMPKGSESARTHYLHITQFDSEEWRKVLSFRDALRNNATLQDQYEALKTRLAQQFPNDRSAYSAGKAAFIQRVA